MPTDTPKGPTKVLRLTIEVPGIWADDLDEAAALCSEPDPPDTDDLLYVVTEEWMRETVTLSIVTLDQIDTPSELHTYMGRIVGADVRDA